ncbi:NUDIX hydrolase [Streptomyces albireticuli]|nr:NUDIX hydrolase [Streptomyces albireticuli]MCD9145472.1 NUDIX hydrolase [Streptomyces albireticuli]MCD9164963.1 NUDIX hydrolase [Streptomyces albireticuli]MCD9195446.1 NUDIX hydrolase [Streptomyces albireticuli]
MTINLAAPPPCRIGGLAWIPRLPGEDREDAVLMVRANYGLKKGFYQLPGGHADHLEPDWEAMLRHVKRETGIVPGVVRLLGKDWVPANSETGSAMGQNLVYLCRPVPATAEIQLPAAEPGMEPELDDYLWMTLDDLAEHTQPYQARRVRAMWEAWQHEAFANLRFGRPVPVERTA